MAKNFSFDPIDSYRQASLQHKASHRQLNELRQMAIAALEVFLQLNGKKADFKGYVAYRNYAIHTWVQADSTFHLNTRLDDKRPGQLRMLMREEQEMRTALKKKREEIAKLKKALCKAYPDSESVKNKRYLSFVDDIPE